MQLSRILFACAVSALTLPAVAQVQGAGSTLARELIGGWATQYGAVAGGASYEAVGSSAGIARVSEQSVDFGASDVPLTAAALLQAGLKQVPLALTAVVVVVNLPELNGKSVRLTGDILADIYQGNITDWSHSQIAGSNPGVKLPAKPIVPLWRADGSGQSYIFSNYLARGNTKWRRNIGSTNNLQLAAGKGVRGGSALLEAVKATPGAVGYESLGAARSSGMQMAELQNASNKFVAPNPASINAAAERAVWQADNNAADLDGSAGADAYPMAAVTYALLPVTLKTGRKNAGPFINQSVAQGDAIAQKAGFNPLPANAKALVAATAK